MPDYHLLKFDVIHPHAYLQRKHREWDDLDALSLDAYRDRLNALRSNYSDYYTHYLDPDVWEGEEFYLSDPVFLQKVEEELYGTAAPVQRTKHRVLSRLGRGPGRQRAVVRDYIQARQPDVLFARSQPFPSAFWQAFRDQSLLVARLSARMPKRWHPEDFDVLYTDVPIFRDFFELHDVPTYLNDQGFDPRVAEELADVPFKRDVSFVGGLGTKNFRRRTQVFEQVAAEVENFQWWGYWWPSWDDTQPTDEFPNLQRTFQGPTSGLEMFEIYKSSRVVLNDYVDTADGLGVNQRMYEVMGVGAFLLTRDAPNLEEDFRDQMFGTFQSADECIEQIRHYLAHPDERQRLADRGQQYVFEHYNYRDIVRDFGQTVRQHLEQDR